MYSHPSLQPGTSRIPLLERPQPVRSPSHTSAHARGGSRVPKIRARRLRPKLLASYVLLGLSITLMSLFGGIYIQGQSAGRSLYRGNLLARTSEVASLANSASEEGFSYVLTGDTAEKEISLAKLASATISLREMAADAQLTSDEGRLFAEVLVALHAQDTAGARVLRWVLQDRRRRARDRYDRYEEALDAEAAMLVDLRAHLRTQNAKDRDATARKSAELTLLVGLAAVLVAIAAGSAFARETSPNRC